ncbi:MAG: hypothetical protein M3O20_16075 [Acidobacteriota bacterium]|nr:hypothetical protein [Acidobacteriota bacterium]
MKQAKYNDSYAKQFWPIAKRLGFSLIQWGHTTEIELRAIIDLINATRKKADSRAAYGSTYARFSGLSPQEAQERNERRQKDMLGELVSINGGRPKGFPQDVEALEKARGIRTKAAFAPTLGLKINTYENILKTGRASKASNRKIAKYIQKNSPKKPR